MTSAEQRLREAQKQWQAAKDEWQRALKAIQMAKVNWEIAQRDFFQPFVQIGDNR
jgi:hypothetical protein